MEALLIAVQYIWHLVLILLIALPAVWLLMKITGVYGKLGRKTINKFKS